MLKFKLETTSISSAVHVRRPDNVGGWRRWFQQVSETIWPIKEIGFRKFWWISWISIFRPTHKSTSSPFCYVTVRSDK